MELQIYKKAEYGSAKTAVMEADGRHFNYSLSKASGIFTQIEMEG